MAKSHQLVDIVLTGFVAGLTTFIVSFFTLDLALAVGMTLASGFYFSRHPWASQDGNEINEEINQLYDSIL